MASSVRYGHRFAHEAMTTEFAVLIAHEDATYARQAADAAFAELDRLEACLSRYRQGSDVFRINRLSAGQSARVQVDTFDCLSIAQEVSRATGGAFDVAYGSKGEPSKGLRFKLDTSEQAIRVLREGLRIDLGGIGKGFALDRMAAILGDWGLERALLCASTSTLLALSPPPGERGWPVAFGPDAGLREVRLVRMAFSASGRSVRGDHIIDPRTGKPAMGWQRCWAAAPTGAVSDALSTAFMVMNETAIRELCRGHADVSAWALRTGDSTLIAFADRLSEAQNP